MALQMVILSVMLCALLQHVSAAGLCCPDGFVRLPDTIYCFKVVLERLDWYQARTRCSNITPGGFLARVLDGATDNFLIQQLKAVDPATTAPCEYFSGVTGQLAYYSSGHLADSSKCNSTWLWIPQPVPTYSMIYKNWSSGSPSCTEAGVVEPCVAYWGAENYKWNDVDCNKPACFICQVKI